MFDLATKEYRQPEAEDNMIPPEPWQARRTHTRTRTHAHTRAHTRANTRIRTRARTHTHSRTRARTHTHAPGPGRTAVLPGPGGKAPGGPWRTMKRYGHEKQLKTCR